jgi:hypothetical protein
MISFKKNQKSGIFCLLIALFSTANLVAQDLHFGLQTSPSWSWMSTDNGKINGSGALLGFKLAIIAENRFSEAYSLSSGIGFHFNSGGRLQFDVPSKTWVNSYDNFERRPADSLVFGKETKFKYNVSFVEIPIGLKMRTPETGNHLRWFIEPNMVLGFRSNAKGGISGAGAGALEQDDIKISKELRPINLAWGIGGGGEYIIFNNTALVLGVYYQQGFTDMTNDEGNTIYDIDGKNPRNESSRGRMHNLTLRIGVMF